MASSFAGKLRLFSAPAQSILRHGRSMATAAHPQQSAITPLHNSCRGGDKEAVKAILKGPQAAKFLNVPEHEGLTPLHLSAAQGHVEIVQLVSNLFGGRFLERRTPNETNTRSPASQLFRPLSSSTPVLAHSLEHKPA